MLSKFALFEDAAAATDGADAGWTTMLIQLVIIGLFVAFFYFFIIRPQSKQQKAAAQMRDSLAVGDRVTTSGGIYGTVIAVKDDTVTIETSADKTKLRVKRWAVAEKEQVEQA